MAVRPIMRARDRRIEHSYGNSALHLRLQVYPERADTDVYAISP